MDPDIVQEMYVAGRRHWPGVELPFDSFVEHCTRVLGEGDGKELRVNATDLYLCCACASGIPEASYAFEREAGAVARAAIARIDRDPEFVQEVLQDLWQKLLVGPAPKVREYAGKGSFRAWLKVAAARTALDRLRARRGNLETLRDIGAELACRDSGPEQRLLRTRHGKALQEALSGAVARLSARERNILRMHVVGGCNIDQIGRAYDVHRATAARWLERVRETIYQSARSQLRTRYRALTDSELQSLVRSLGAEVELSLFDRSASQR